MNDDSIPPIRPVKREESTEPVICKDRDQRLLLVKMPKIVMDVLSKQANKGRVGSVTLSRTTRPDGQKTSEISICFNQDVTHGEIPNTYVIEKNTRLNNPTNPPSFGISFKKGQIKAACDLMSKSRKTTKDRQKGEELAEEALSTKCRPTVEGIVKERWNMRASTSQDTMALFQSMYGSKKAEMKETKDVETSHKPILLERSIIPRDAVHTSKSQVVKNRLVNAIHQQDMEETTARAFQRTTKK
ncbi:hypothetical protein BLNAU_553 [Blattamonas nauphoetae]|uniref:Uncharacterized protein n=1 Tax=Blattamonas nauphoetae TaxID=2049346 RepID=A0ABQ9YLJ3_9EUKA|nr:hypothetical protein BLNAU_553 [Blattamonas nauphoetae]